MALAKLPVRANYQVCNDIISQPNYVVVVHIYPPVTEQRPTLTLLDVPHTFYCDDYFVVGGIHTC